MGQNDKMNNNNNFLQIEKDRPDIVYIIQPEEFYNWKKFMYDIIMDYVRDNYEFFKENVNSNHDKFRIFSYVTKNIKNKIRDGQYFKDIEYIDRYIKLYNNTVSIEDIKKEPNFQLFESENAEDIKLLYINDENKVYKTLPEMIKFINGGKLNDSVYIYYDYSRYFKVRQFGRWIDVRFSKTLISDLFVFEQLIWRNKDKSFDEMENLLDNIFINKKMEYTSDIEYTLTARDIVDFYHKRYKYLGCNTQRSDDFE